MKVIELLKNIKGTIVLEIEGFYVERFINLCKIQNIEILELKYVTAGLVSLKTKPKNFKTIKKIAKKTKCRVRIKKKKGIYFVIFKYRKRRAFLYSLIVVCLILCFLSTFILNINIKGNDKIPDEFILRALNDAGLSKWKNKLFINKSKITSYLRTNIYEIAWIGLEIEGTNANIEIVEKIVEKEDVGQNVPGDIIASKSGVITKIIAENGIAKILTGSYIEKGMVAISGIIPSEIIGDTQVHAKGILRVKNENAYEVKEKYIIQKKKYTGKNKFGIGISINNREYLLKYLPKKSLYDINKKEKSFDIFGIKIGFVFNKYKMYDLKEKERDYDKLVTFVKNKYEKYIEENISEEAKILNQDFVISKEEDGIKCTVNYVVEEEVRDI